MGVVPGALGHVSGPPRRSRAHLPARSATPAAPSQLRRLPRACWAHVASASQTACHIRFVGNEGCEEVRKAMDTHTHHSRGGSTPHMDEVAALRTCRHV